MRMVTNIIIPYTLPEVLRNLITLYGIGWTYVIIAETKNAIWGLGHLMDIGSQRGNTPMVFAALMAIIIINIVFDKVGTISVKKAFPWRYKT
jgi:NitT/TauT family transport system permease protein